MDRLLTSENLRRVAEEVLAWLLANVLVWSTLLQAGMVVAAFGVMHFLRPHLTASLTGRADRLPAGSVRAVGLALAESAAWLILLMLIFFAEFAFVAMGLPSSLLRLAESLAIAWVIIRLSSRLVRSPALARAFSVVAWIIAALNIAGLIGPTVDLMNAMAISVGTFRISVLLVLKGTLLLVTLIWLANLASRLAEQRLSALSGLAPAMQVLASKLIRIGLLTLAVVMALGAVGIDLTAFAVFSGAIGVGIGFGLQKVVSNLISGVILLLDRSIKPGDVIQIDGTYGWITKLNARFVSVVTRDGLEYLIPNEDLITQRVVNWSYSNDLIRLHVPIGIGYNSDVRAAMGLVMAAIESVERVLKTPKPICLLKGFGDSSVDLEARFWINDPRNGTANVKSQVLLNIWDSFKEAGVELPFPQRDLTLRNPQALADALAHAKPGDAR